MSLMVDYQEIFINNLKRIRKERGITQLQLAEMCDVSNGTIGNIESAVTKPSFDLLLKFADKLHVQPGDFFFSKEISNTVRSEEIQNLEKSIIDYVHTEFARIS